ncbi:hypothetical protein AN642_00305 [Epulopiscium sp. SCG-B10WGA-EpuloA2]|nr:hypothetical protein AN642_00305 [Epulopiscium sp. SCG-B10WGA-EpuloA2]
MIEMTETLRKIYKKYEKNEKDIFKESDILENLIKDIFIKKNDRFILLQAIDCNVPQMIAQKVTSIDDKKQIKLIRDELIVEYMWPEDKAHQVINCFLYIRFGLKNEIQVNPEQTDLNLDEDNQEIDKNKQNKIKDKDNPKQLYRLHKKMLYELLYPNTLYKLLYPIIFIWIEIMFVFNQLILARKKSWKLWLKMPVYIIIILSVYCLILLFSSMSFFSNIKAPNEYYSRALAVSQDLENSLEKTIKDAEKGDREAQYNLAQRYENGDGVFQDVTKAVEWYAKSAQQGHTDAQISLDNLAQQNNADAQYNLAWAYHYGNGIKKDLNKAIELYIKAAEQGHINAQYNLGWCYEYGDGVTKNLDKALEWYNLAAEQGHIFAQHKAKTLQSD